MRIYGLTQLPGHVLRRVVIEALVLFWVLAFGVPYLVERWVL